MTETGNTVERLAGWADESEAGMHSRFHRPYANPGELRRDVRSLLAVVEAAQELVEAHVDVIAGVAPKNPRWCADDREAYDARFSRWHDASRRVRQTLAALHSQASDEGKP